MSRTRTGTSWSGVVLGPQVTVDEDQRAVGQLAGEQGVGVADLGQDPAEGVGLGLRVCPPVLRVRRQVAGPDAA
jgi:hypothetical protein